MKEPKYFVTDPVHHGTAYYNVRERESPIMPNFAVATFSRHMPHAEKEARELCARLNKENPK